MREAVPRHFLAIIDLLLDIKKMPTSYQRVANELPASCQRVANELPAGCRRVASELPLKFGMFSCVCGELPRVAINI